MSTLEMIKQLNEMKKHKLFVTKMVNIFIRGGQITFRWNEKKQIIETKERKIKNVK